MVAEANRLLDSMPVRAEARQGYGFMTRRVRRTEEWRAMGM